MLLKRFFGEWPPEAGGSGTKLHEATALWATLGGRCARPSSLLAVAGFSEQNRTRVYGLAEIFGVVSSSGLVGVSPMHRRRLCSRTGVNPVRRGIRVAATRTSGRGRSPSCAP